MGGTGCGASEVGRLGPATQALSGIDSPKAHSYRGIDVGEQNASENKGGTEPRFCLCPRAEGSAWRQAVFAE